MSSSSLSRRSFLAGVGLCATTATIGARASKAEAPSPILTIREEAARTDITVRRLHDRFSVLEGSGGNIGVATGPEGAIMIDSGIAVSKSKILAALQSLGAQRIPYLVNTHWHFDHTDGNAWVHAEGAIIVAHRNTLKWLSRSVHIDDWNFTFPPASQGALPTVVFDDAYELKANGLTVSLHHYGPAHTDSDIAIHLQEMDILHVADTFWNGHFPFIDYKTGGSIEGMIRAADGNIKTAGPKTIVVPGHGPIGNRDDLKAFHDMLATVFERVSALKKKGMSEEEVVVAHPTGTFDDKWGSYVINPGFFARLVYRGA